MGYIANLVWRSQFLLRDAILAGLFIKRTKGDWFLSVLFNFSRVTFIENALGCIKILRMKQIPGLK